MNRQKVITKAFKILWVKPVNNTSFSIGTFRDLPKTEKQEQLARDIDTYNLDVCCLQETKIKDGLDAYIGVKKHRLVSLQSVLWEWICYNQKIDEKYTPVVESVQ